MRASAPTGSASTPHPEPLGGDSLVACGPGGRKPLVHGKPDDAAERGAPCYLTFDIKRWHLFSRETGLGYF